DRRDGLGQRRLADDDATGQGRRHRADGGQVDRAGGRGAAGGQRREQQNPEQGQLLHRYSLSRCQMPAPAPAAASTSSTSTPIGSAVSQPRAVPVWSAKSTRAWLMAWP